MGTMDESAQGSNLGFMVRALSWLGLSIGLAVGLRLTPRLARSLTDSTPGVRLLAVASLLVGLALIGHTTGLVASQTIRRRYSLPEHVAPFDRFTGGLLGALGALALLWLLIPALRNLRVRSLRAGVAATAARTPGSRRCRRDAPSAAPLSATGPSRMGASSSSSSVSSSLMPCGSPRARGASALYARAPGATARPPR